MYSLSSLGEKSNLSSRSTEVLAETWAYIHQRERSFQKIVKTLKNIPARVLTDWLHIIVGLGAENASPSVIGVTSVETGHTVSRRRLQAFRKRPI
jgi:hypothetical protein